MSARNKLLLIMKKEIRLLNLNEVLNVLYIMLNRLFKHYWFTPSEASYVF